MNITPKVKIKVANAKTTFPEYVARLPKYQTPGAAGCDIAAAEYCILRPGESALVSTGIFLEVPEGFECQVRPRSGLAVNHAVTVLNSPGTIDSDYRGEVKVLLYNAGDQIFSVREGDRIAQLVFAPVVQVSFVEVDELSDTARGLGGFGSTGEK